MKEEEIRPKEMFDRFLELSELDCDRYFSDAETTEIPCPACGASGIHSFEKNSFGYDECPQCLTLYVNPRPRAKYFEEFYQYSDSQKYWANEFYAATASARKAAMWEPKAARILEILETHGVYPVKDTPVINIGAGYGIFEDVVRENSFFPTVSIEPNPNLKPVLEEKGHRVITAFFENLDPGEIRKTAGEKYHFVSFELLEHLVDPGRFLEHLKGYLPPNGLFIATTLSSTGVDIRELWDKSKVVSPPFHLNFFNPASVRKLATTHGFELVDVFTPGELDVDILCNNLQDLGRFWKTTLQQADEESKDEIQKFFVRQNLSYHMWFILRKNDA